MHVTNTASEWQLNTPSHTAPEFRHIDVYVISVTWQHMGSQLQKWGV